MYFEFLCVAGCFCTFLTFGKGFSVTTDLKTAQGEVISSDIRLKRAVIERVVPAKDNSGVIHKEGEVYKGPADIYWKDNSETARLRQLRPGDVEPTITRVIHHGIYPSLEVSEPIRQANSSRFKSRTKRDWLKSKSGNTNQGTTITDYRYEETGTSSGTFHQESTFQVKEGPRTVIDRRNSHDSSVHTAYVAQYPKNSNTGAQNVPKTTSYPNYNSRVPTLSHNNGRVPTPPSNGNRRVSDQRLRTTTPAYTRYEETGTSSGTFHQESKFQVNEGPRTVIDRRNSHDSSVHTAYVAQYPKNSNTGVQSGPTTNFGAPSYPNYNSRVPTPPRDGYWRGNDQRFYTTTPGYTRFVRAKRESGLRSRRDSTARSNHYWYEQTSSHLQNGSASIHHRWDNQNGTVKTTHRVPNNYSNFHSNFDSVNSSHYVRAQHPRNGNYSFYTSQFVYPSRNGTNSTSKYRTLYYPEGNSVDSRSYRGDRSNKGNVKLISVGYYAVNKSRDGVRSYYNPPGAGRTGLSESPRTNGFEPTRAKRDVGSWSWLDKLMVSIGLAELKTSKKAQPSESKTMKLEVEDGFNEVIHNQYDYAPSGDHLVEPTQIDRIYLVGPASPQTTPSPPFRAAAVIAVDPHASDPADYDDVLLPNEDLQILLPLSSSQPVMSPRSANVENLPKTKEVLIQAPLRFIDCEPPLRLARGRCRRVWRSKP
ncbi:hypothetical protein GE061_006624 [Apolygus lucorum]|uniref:Uncharacterized protein n=1 Tax=Apolygus lucorum TaxID=248454 RepID=A0A6A4JCS1_APOLU|nr:hypothetical protein GE061_006624 [Apolygus lucorum]